MYKIELKSELPHQQRVIVEANELGLKIDALNLFIEENPIFERLNLNEQIRLGEQVFVMSQYFNILKERIENF
jgi:hypothetical protein